MSEEINDQSVILITGPSPSLSGLSQSNYTITAITPDTTLGTSTEMISQLPTFLEKSHFLSHLPPHLCLPPEDIHVIISIKSGAGQAEVTFDNILKPVLNSASLGETGYQVLRTESSDTVRDFAGGRLRVRANEGAAQTVILLSGDGGVVDFINGLMNNDEPRSKKFVRPTLALLPLGTGNALFHSLHYALLPLPLSPSPPTPSAAPTDLTLALRTLLFGTPHPLPVFRTTFSPHSRLLSNYGRTALPLPGPATPAIYGAIVASYGLHATLVADSDTPAWRQHGAARFSMVARELLAVPHAYRAKLVLQMRDGRDVVVGREEHGYVLLTLVSHLEKTFTISPASRPLDGRLRAVHFGPESGVEVGRIMGLAYQGGGHVGEEKVGYEEVRGMRVEFLEGEGERGNGGDGDGDEMEGRWRRVCVDGLIVRVEEGGWMEVSEVPEGERAVEIVVAPGILGA